MLRSTLVVLSVFLCLGLVACGKAKEAMDQASISEDLKDKGTLDLLQEASEDQYEPPADGRLNDKQIQMYMKVRERERVIAQTALKEAEATAKKVEGKEKSLAGMMAGLQTLGSVADLFTADIRAARDLGFNTAEYQWVKEKVIEASGAAFGEKMSESFTTMVDGQIAALEQQLATNTDPDTRKILQDALDGAKKGRSEMTQQQVDPTIAYNKQLLSKYENALNALASELSKWQGDEGDAKKAVQEWEQGLAKAKAESTRN